MLTKSLKSLDLFGQSGPRLDVSTFAGDVGDVRKSGAAYKHTMIRIVIRGARSCMKVHVDDRLIS